MKLQTLYTKLSKPTTENEYCAIPISGYARYKLAKSYDGFPVLIIEVSDNKNLNNIVLNNISVLHSFPCVVKVKGKRTLESKFSIIQCSSVQENLTKAFFEIIELGINSIGVVPTSAKIDSFVYQLLDLLARLVEPPVKYIQGLWAELLLIDQSKNSRALIERWHFNSTDKYDFSSGEERIEVKSFTSNYRAHNFSIEQLNPPYKCKLLIASINTIRANTGISIIDLRDQICRKISSHPQLIEKITLEIMRCLGHFYQQADSVKFDYEVGVSSIKFYDSSKIPKINPHEVPKSVFDVKFKVDLSGLAEFNIRKQKNKGSLFSAI